jgi:hypothetical protein
VSRSLIDASACDIQDDHLHFCSCLRVRFIHGVAIRIEKGWGDACTNAYARIDETFVIGVIGTGGNGFGSRPNHHLDDLSAKVDMGQRVTRFMECKR